MSRAKGHSTVRALHRFSREPSTEDPDGMVRSGLLNLLARKRVQLLTSLVVVAVLPLLVRAFILTGPAIKSASQPSSVNTFAANLFAVLFAFWLRLAIESYPGIQRAYLILFSTFIAHGVALTWFALTRSPYDRVGLVLGFGIHVLWQFAVFASTELRVKRRIAVVPLGNIQPLKKITEVEWLLLSRARLHDARACQAIVADFNADLPEEWEAFLAEAALAGRIVYQVKQLSESLTGRVELEHLSENSFGSLVPARGYFYLKSAGDYCLALLLLPIMLPVMILVGLTIRLDSKGPALFVQKRTGYAGKHIHLYKFRTMRDEPLQDDRTAAMTRDDDDRVTRVGRILRKLRLDELPQIFNIIKGEMSWIGPRPEADVLSRWYEGELPFYRYRHVVKPGISGWAQVNQGHVSDVEQVHRKLQYDFYYIKYFSPWLDLLILIRTLKTMLTGFGSR